MYTGLMLERWFKLIILKWVYFHLKYCLYNHFVFLPRLANTENDLGCSTNHNDIWIHTIHTRTRRHCTTNWQLFPEHHCCVSHQQLLFKQKRWTLCEVAQPKGFLHVCAEKNIFNKVSHPGATTQQLSDNNIFKGHNCSQLCVSLPVPFL